MPSRWLAVAHARLITSCCCLVDRNNAYVSVYNSAHAVQNTAETLGTIFCQIYVLCAATGGALNMHASMMSRVHLPEKR